MSGTYGTAPVIVHGAYGDSDDLTVVVSQEGTAWKSKTALCAYRLTGEDATDLSVQIGDSIRIGTGQFGILARDWSDQEDGEIDPDLDLSTMPNDLMVSIGVAMSRWLIG